MHKPIFFTLDNQQVRNPNSVIMLLALSQIPGVTVVNLKEMPRNDSFQEISRWTFPLVDGESVRALPWTRLPVVKGPRTPDFAKHMHSYYKIGSDAVSSALVLDQVARLIHADSLREIRLLSEPPAVYRAQTIHEVRHLPR